MSDICPFLPAVNHCPPCASHANNNLTSPHPIPPPPPPPHPPPPDFSISSICIFGKPLPRAAFSSLYFGTEIIIVFMTDQVHGYKINRSILRRSGVINFKFPRSLPTFSFLLPEEQSKNIIKRTRNPQLLPKGKLHTFIFHINLTTKKALSV